MITSEYFTHKAFNPISCYRTTDFFTDGNADSCCAMFIGIPNNQNSPAGILMGCMQQPEKFWTFT